MDPWRVLTGSGPTNAEHLGIEVAENFRDLGASAYIPKYIHLNNGRQYLQRFEIESSLRLRASLMKQYGKCRSRQPDCIRTPIEPDQNARPLLPCLDLPEVERSKIWIARRVASGKVPEVAVNLIEDTKRMASCV
jgi:hypothetical protein